MDNLQTNEQVIEVLMVGCAMLLIQNFIVMNSFFGEAEIKKYIVAREAFHPLLVEAAQKMVVAIEADEYGPALMPAITPLRSLSNLNKKQVQQALVLVSRAFRSLSHLRPGDVEDGQVFRLVWLSWKFMQSVDPANPYGRENPEYLFRQVLKSEVVPAPIRTIVRKLIGSGINRPDYPQDEANPGAWFDMVPEERVALRSHVQELLKEQDQIYSKYENSDDRQRAYREVAKALEEAQARAGVHAKIITREDAEPLEAVLRREAKLQVDGPTAFLLEKLKDSLLSNFEEYPGQRGALTKRELGKIITQLERSRTFGTAERVLREAVDRKLLSLSTVQDFTRQVARAKKNKALSEGRPLVPLTYEPLSPEEFQAKHDTGEIIFDDQMFPPEEQKDVLGRVSRAISDLEMIFGKGFCGKHKKKLEFHFNGGGGGGLFTKASYFMWVEKNTGYSYRREKVFQPHVSFGEKYEGLLAHELSHYFDDMLGFQVQEKELAGRPRQYENLGGTLFVNGGVPVTTVLDIMDKGGNKGVAAQLPEAVEIMRAIAASPDYARWVDKVNASVETFLSKAIQNVTGRDPYSDPELEKIVGAHYKSEIPPEILAEAEKLYRNIMEGDDRKLSYYQSAVEVWARMTEQYVYTKLARMGIANPWLTQMTYDIDEDDVFMDQKRFEELLEPIYDRLFARLKGDGLVQKLASLWLALRDF